MAEGCGYRGVGFAAPGPCIRHFVPQHSPPFTDIVANPLQLRAPTMSRYGKLILIIGVAVACAVGAILPFAFASSAERDEDANALRDVGRVMQRQGVITNYSIAV